MLFARTLAKIFQNKENLEFHHINENIKLSNNTCMGNKKRQGNTIRVLGTPHFVTQRTLLPNENIWFSNLVLCTNMYHGPYTRYLKT